MVEVLDLEGTPINVPAPDELDSIVITSWKGAYGAVVLLGQMDRITGMSDTSRYGWLRYAFPEILEVADYGAFDEVNVEELLQADPDIIISPAAASLANEKMRSLDMPVVVDGVDIEDKSDVFAQMKQEIDLIAQLTGSEDAAAEYFAWKDDLLALVADRVADIPDDERVTALPLRRDITEVYGNNWSGGYAIELAGGINLAGESTAGLGTKFFTDVDAEQIVEWDPDMMFQLNFAGEFTDEVANLASGWANDQRFSDMQAFDSGHVYLAPKGIDHWQSDIELPLMVLWTAKTMYPELFEDMDPKQEAEDFYKQFLDYDIAAEDWAIIAPQFTGFQPNGLSS